jgi:hypothetical protein
MASSAAITASAAYAGCTGLLGTFFSTKKETANMPATTDCLVEEWTEDTTKVDEWGYGEWTQNADWLSNPCCNEALLNNQCCNPQSGGTREVDVIDTLHHNLVLDTW